MDVAAVKAGVDAAALKADVADLKTDVGAIQTTLQRFETMLLLVLPLLPAFPQPMPTRPSDTESRARKEKDAFGPKRKHANVIVWEE